MQDGVWAQSVALQAMRDAPPMGGLTISQYLGFALALERWGTDNEANIQRKIKWQKDVGGNSQKNKQFQDMVGALQVFKMHLLL